MPLPASIGHLHARTLQVKNWSQNASLPNTQARVLGGIFAPTRRATNHEVIYREVVFIKLSFFLSHSSGGIRIKGECFKEKLFNSSGPSGNNNNLWEGG